MKDIEWIGRYYSNNFTIAAAAASDKKCFYWPLGYTKSRNTVRTTFMPLRFNVAMLFAIFWVIIFNLSAVNCVWYNKSFNQSTPLLYFSSSTYQHKKNSGCFYKSTESYSRVHKITYEFGGPSEKKCQFSLIFYCKISIVCQSLAKSAQILLVMSDWSDKFHELCYCYL